MQNYIYQFFYKNCNYKILINYYRVKYKRKLNNRHLIVKIYLLIIKLKNFFYLVVLEENSRRILILIKNKMVNNKKRLN